jgi:hypothetical protein
VRQAQRNFASITVTPDADLSAQVQISGVSGIWSKRDGGSHIEYGDEQIIAVFESPIQIEHRLEMAGSAGPKHDDTTRLPVLRRTTLFSSVWAAYDWFRDPNSSYEVAAANIDQTLYETHDGYIEWRKISDTLYEGSQSVDGTNASGTEFTYRLKIGTDGHVTYRYSQFVDAGRVAAPRATVNVGKSTLGFARQGGAIQHKLGILLDAVQIAAAQRAVAKTQKQIGEVG